MPTINDGDCMVSLAAETGCRDYQTLWKANEALKKDCPNPNMLLSGKEYTPAIATKVENKAHGKRWTYVVPKRKPASLKLILLGADGKPLPGAKWEMTDPVKASGETGGSGKIEIPDFPPAAKTATLQITPPTPAKTDPSPQQSGGSSAAYPPPVKPGEFMHAGRASGDSAIIEWSLKIGSLPPAAHELGVLARLHNLGAACDPDRKESLIRTVKAYQRTFLNQTAPSGTYQDIQSDLEKRHDRP